MPREQREEALVDFKRGAVEVLASVAMLTQGVDLPHVRTVALCRPTTSPRLFSQMVGRGARIDTEATDGRGKEFNVLEFTDNLVRHGEVLLQGRAALGLSALPPSPLIEARPGVREIPAYTRRTRHQFDLSGAPVLLIGDDLPPAAQGLWLCTDHTFGLEFELTASGFDEIGDGEWMRRANVVLDTIRRTVGSHRTALMPSSTNEPIGADPNERWQVKYDSSAGWEITSPILEGEAGAIELCDVLEAVRSVASTVGLRSNSRTGLHLHLGWDGQPLDAVVRLIRLVRELEPSLACLIAPSRVYEHDIDTDRYAEHRPNPFCRPISSVFPAAALNNVQSFDDIEHRLRSRDSRNCTVNLRNLRKGTLDAAALDGTVEVRMHNGTLDPRVVLLWTSLWQQIVHVASNRSWWRDPRDVPDTDGLAPSGDLREWLSAHSPMRGSPVESSFLEAIERRRQTIAEIYAYHPGLKGRYVG